MANISKIALPSGDIYDIMDAFAREQIAILKETVAGGVQYVGATTTALSDGATTATVAIRTGDTTTEDHTAAVGDMVDYNNVLYIFNKNSQWDQLGSAGALKALAYKDNVSADYTPKGSVAAPTFTGNALTSTGKFTPKGSVTAPTFTGTEGNVSVSGTPSGTNSVPAFTGTEGNVSVSGTPSGSVSVDVSAPGTGETATYTPEGTVTVTPNTSSIQQITGVGSLPSLTTTVADETLTIGFSQGSLPTRAAVTVATGVKSASFAGTGKMIKGSFTGKALTSTGKFTPKGSVAAPTFTGDALTSTGKFTPKGSVTAPTFTGTEGNVSVSGTPSGTNSVPAFTGTKETITSK